MIVGILVGNIVVTLKNIDKAFANFVEQFKLMLRKNLISGS